MNQNIVSEVLVLGKVGINCEPILLIHDVGFKLGFSKWWLGLVKLPRNECNSI